MMQRLTRRTLALLLACVLLLSLAPQVRAVTPLRDGLTEIVLPNGDFETGAEGWSFTGLTGEIIENSSSATNKTNVLNLWASDDQQVEIAVSYPVKLTAGTYKFSFDVDGADTDSLLRVSITAGEDVLFSGEDTIVTTGWDNWETLETGEFSLTEDTEIVFTISGTGPVGYWGHLDNLKLFGTGAIYTPPMELTEIVLPNGDFENGAEGWSFTGLTGEIIENSSSATNKTNVLNLWASNDQQVEIAVSYPVKLTAGTYKFSFDVDGADTDSQLRVSITADEDVLFSGEDTIVTTGWDNWETLETGEFSLTEDTEIVFTISGTGPVGYWGHLDNLKLFGTGAIYTPPMELTEIVLPNGDFENGAEGWSFTGLTGEIIENSSSPTNKTNVLNLWASNDQQVEIAVSYPVKLTAGTYKFCFDVDGADADSLLRVSITAGEDVLFSGEDTIVTTGWDNWETLETGEFSLTEDTEIVFTISGTGPVGYWGHLDNLKLFGTGAIAGSPAVEFDHEPTLTVEKLNGVAEEDFMRGTDVSSYLSIINSGATYYDYEGTPLDEQGFFNLLASAGFNYIRLRVWNNPFNSEGKGYGGGNCDVNAALQMGRWATNAGMKVLIDFHYSDFWADPGKQKVPKAWAGYTADQKAEAVDAFTYASLKTLLDGGVNVGMVQVGNETTNSICGESSWANKAKIFSAGSAAVRRISAEYEHPILVAVHFTNPERSGNYASQAQNLNNYNVDYDVFASSWYPYWHGTTANLTSVLKQVADTYGKKVVVAETSWAWTLEDGDGHENTVRNGNNDSNNAYPFSQQGQADELTAAAKAVLNVGEAGIGVFYWENAWIPVQYAYDESGALDQTILTSNKAKWEEFGSGWAASYAAEYDPNDAGVWFGGSAVDNQANFDFHGKALDSLWTWKYMMAGTAPEVEQEVLSVEEVSLTLNVGDTFTLPETLTVKYNVGADTQSPVVWNAEDLAAVNPAVAGTYTVRGTVTTAVGEQAVTATVTFLNPNLLLNPSFELSDMSMYTYENGSRTGDDPHTGSRSFHFYNAAAKTVKLEQTVQLEPGTYTFSLFAQGDSKGSDDIYIYVKAGDNELSRQSFALAGWAAWQNPQLEFEITETTSVTVGLHLAFGAGGWGTVDDLYLGLLRAPEPVFDPAIENTLALEGATTLNYYVDKPALDAWNPDSFKLVVVHTAFRGGSYVEETVELSPDPDYDASGYYLFRYPNIAAKELNDRMVAHVEALKGDVVLRSPEKDYNPMTYCYTVACRESSDPALRRTCADMIRYAAAAQTYFSYNTENMADADWDTIPAGIATEGDPQLESFKESIPLEGQTCEIKTYTLDVSGRVNLNYYVRPDDMESFESLKLVCTYQDKDNNPVEVEIPGTAWTLYNNTYGYVATLQSLNAGEMREIITAVVKDADGNVISNTYKTSIESYAKTIADRNTNPALINLLKAMLVYGDSARTYLG